MACFSLSFSPLRSLHSPYYSSSRLRLLISPPLPLPLRQIHISSSLVPHVELASSSSLDSQAPAISRRDSLLLTILPLAFLSLPVSPSLARERRNRKIIPPEDFNTSSEGIKYYDIVEGKGPAAEKGSTVQVHFDCMYRGITVVSSRESKLLAGNRIIAQPYEFTVGSPPGKERKRDFVDTANGLYSAQAAPKPPPALYSVTEGMKAGGTRTVIVPSELGYGKRGMNEIPPGATFELNVELLQVNPKAK